MSFDPDSRFAQHMCENCRRRTELKYSRSRDEYLCEQCFSSLVPNVELVSHDDQTSD